MPSYGSLLFCFLLLAGVAGCASTERGPQPASEPPETPKYDRNSWRQMIPEDCLVYFDGCNTCRRNPETGIAACTRKACAVYSKPYCMDDQAQSGTTGGQADLQRPSHCRCRAVVPPT